MNPPPLVDPDYTQRAAALGELAAKVGGGVLALWAVVMKIYVPFRTWRQRAFAEQIRAVLAPEIQLLHRITKADDTCVERLQVVLDQQAVFAEELDVFLELAKDNRARHDETADLLNALIPIHERRHDDRRDARFDTLIEHLVERRRERLRARPTPPTEGGP